MARPRPMLAPLYVEFPPSLPARGSALDHLSRAASTPAWLPLVRWGKMGLMDVDRCAAHAVKALIYRQPFTIPGLSNRLTYMASRALPQSLVSRIAALPYRHPH
jgi:hypothetical protein